MNETAAIVFDGSASSGVMAFPNPFHNSIMIVVETLDMTDALVELFDPLGQLLLNKKLHIDADSNALRFEGLENLAPGIYTLRFTTGLHSEMTRIIKR